jgi:hypothetical protein
MAGEPEVADTESFSNVVNFYEVQYLITSWYVHSNVMGVRDLMPETGEVFRFKVAEPVGISEIAIVMAAHCLAISAMRISHALGLGKSDAIKESWDRTVGQLVV